MPDKIKILIVDDEPDFVVSLRERLEFEGFEVHQAPDGQSGLEGMRRESFDVVLLDIMMPGVDGFEVLRTVRKEGGKLARPLIIAMTVYGRELMDEERRSLDPALFIRKPFEPERLLKIIRDALARKAAGT